LVNSTLIPLIRSVLYEHDKAYLPNEEDVWESTWYNRGAKDFAPYAIELGNNKRVLCSFQICSELWFMEHGRSSGQQGAHIILSPRASGPNSLPKWTAGGLYKIIAVVSDSNSLTLDLIGQSLAVISGCYSVSSNRSADGQFGGKGWIISPDGELLDFTTSEKPVVFADIDIDLANEAKKTYPRNIVA
jgi:N-carbamoylputrescine amidase